MKIKIILIFLTILAIPIVAGILFWLYGNYVIMIGENNSAWITHEMWDAPYLNSHSQVLNKGETIYLASLQAGASKNKDIMDYLWENKCEDSSWSCALIMTAVSNLLLDNRDYDTGLKAAVEAYDRIKGSCSIAYESAILKYKIQKLSASTGNNSGSSVRAILYKIKNNGGLMSNLRTDSCNKLAREQPEFFHAYVMLVAQLMGFAGGDYLKASVYMERMARRLD
jgi:hypothetical protein